MSELDILSQKSWADKMEEDSVNDGDDTNDLSRV